MYFKNKILLRVQIPSKIHEDLIIIILIPFLLKVLKSIAPIKNKYENPINTKLNSKKMN
jgi:hypothetical protein